MDKTIQDDLAPEDSPVKHRRLSPWRRLTAYLIDYFVAILPIVAVLSLLSWLLRHAGWNPLDDNPWLAQLIVFVTLTVPVAAYFALYEASRHQATVGKRVMRVAVVNLTDERATLKQTTIRVALKFLPWEYFHTILFHWEGWPLNPAAPTTLQLVGIAIGWAVIAWFIVSLFVGSGRTPYDRAAGTIVVDLR